MVIKIGFEQKFILKNLIKKIKNIFTIKPASNTAGIGLYVNY